VLAFLFLPIFVPVPVPVPVPLSVNSESFFTYPLKGFFVALVSGCSGQRGVA
jgi:hypothetical protein